MTSQLFAAAASVALLGAGFASLDGTRSMESLPAVQTITADGVGGAAKKCRVDVVRAGTPGAADIVRDELTDGTCVCIITTGPANNNGAAESIVTNLLRDRTCEGAPPPAGKPAAFVGTPFLIPAIVGTVGAAGAAGLAATAGNDSAG
ncbi:MAG TPA: hypothetical protein VFV30_11370 [Novosphingobium sp.]|nr:hypothetical protein [Novosphingobium sp.]